MSTWPFEWDNDIKFDVNDFFVRVYVRSTWVDLCKVPARAGAVRAGDSLWRIPATDAIRAFLEKWKPAHMRLVIGVLPMFGPDFSADFSSDFNSVRYHKYAWDLKQDARGDFSADFDVDFDHGLSGSFNGDEFDSSFDRYRVGVSVAEFGPWLDNSFDRDEFSIDFATN